MALPVLGAVAATGGAHPQSSARVDYLLHVDPRDLSAITVEMRIHGAPKEFRVAMVAHTEYDDAFWRYLTDLHIEAPAVVAQATREDSAVWRIGGAGDDVTLRYRVHFPVSTPQQQAVWQAHLTPEGGLVGGPHSFLYVVGGERWPSTVVLDLPAGWSVVTGLDAAANAHTFTAPDVVALTDSPILVGRIRSWRFNVASVEHRISYLGHPGGTTFDTTRFVEKVERLTRETVRMFGRMPYRRFEFLFEDGAYGGLEHLNSVSIGARSTMLAREPDGLLGQIAHEFFHTWNEVHLRPESWIGVRHTAPAPTGELWWSEGVTLYYADLLLRRAGLTAQDSTRLAHLTRMLTSYAANPSHAMVSPEASSRAFNLPPSAMGDYTPSMFTQGELIGTVLDLMIRGATSGRRSLDDAMRALTSRFSIDRGFTGNDVERAVAETCGCDAHPFFDRYVRRAGALDFDHWLAVIGLRWSVAWAPAVGTDGAAAPDLRVSTTQAAGGGPVLLRVWFPQTIWGQAGLHTGDRVDSLNGSTINDSQQFREAIGRLHVGDTVRLVLTRGGTRIPVSIPIAGYERPTVRLEALPDASPAQRMLFAEWAAGR